MALHDPESTEQEKALALKIGRQKKIQIIDGQQVEVLTGDDEDEEDEDEMDLDEDDLPDPTGGHLGTGVEQKMMAVEGQDGQQYVVLEVIQLPENAAGTSAAAIKVEPGKPVTPGKASNSNIVPKKATNEKKQADLATAFGFESDEDDMDDEDS